MRTVTRILTIGMMTMMALSGSAAASGLLVDADAAATADDAALNAEALANGDTRYVDLDAAAATDDLGASLDTDANVAEVESVESGGFFGWLEVRFATFTNAVGSLFAKLGVEQPEAVADANLDGGVETYVSTDGLDLDASVAGHSFDDSPVGGLDGATFEGMATLHSEVEEVQASLPPTG